jgi:hypothetical protein
MRVSLCFTRGPKLAITVLSFDRHPLSAWKVAAAYTPPGSGLDPYSTIDTVSCGEGVPKGQTLSIKKERLIPTRLQERERTETKVIHNVSPSHRQSTAHPWCLRTPGLSPSAHVDLHDQSEGSKQTSEYHSRAVTASKVQGGHGTTGWR